MHSFDVGDICNWNGALSQALNHYQGYKFFIEE